MEFEEIATVETLDLSEDDLLEKIYEDFPAPFWVKYNRFKEALGEERLQESEYQEYLAMISKVEWRQKRQTTMHY